MQKMILGMWRHYWRGAQKEDYMNTDQISGNWKQLKGEALNRWGKLTDDQWDQAEGNRIKLAGVLQKTYGIAREKAEEEIREWESKTNRDAAA
jgi:uncharacterized protein YjbJ (UPF0337 family)